MKKIFLTALVLTSFSSFAQDEKRVVVVSDLTAGNGGVGLAVGPQVKILPGVKLTGSVHGAMDIQKTEKEGYITTTTSSAFSPSVGASAGIDLSLDIFHINPLIMYKCESANQYAPKDDKSSYGCGSRAGVNILLGKSNGVQVGAGWTRALTDVNHGEKDEFQFMLRIPLSANDQERLMNDKGDMDFNDKKKEKDESRAVSA